MHTFGFGHQGIGINGVSIHRVLSGERHWFGHKTITPLCRTPPVSTPPPLQKVWSPLRGEGHTFWSHGQLPEPAPPLPTHPVQRAAALRCRWLDSRVVQVGRCNQFQPSGASSHIARGLRRKEPPPGVLGGGGGGSKFNYWKKFLPPMLDDDYSVFKILWQPSFPSALFPMRVVSLD